MTPTRLAELARELGLAAGLTVEVWDGGQILAQRLGGLAGVAAGSAEPPRLIRMRLRAGRRHPTVALVGQGHHVRLRWPVAQAAGRDDDYEERHGRRRGRPGGRGRGRRPRVSACGSTGWIAATENMPSGTAIHPGDVLVARNGTSIEVLNTDAEGRLVLADALALAVEENPDAIIDIATLTGAQRVALGGGVAAVLGNDDDLVERVVAAGSVAGEPTWRLPLVAAYRKQLDSDVADIKNVAAAPAAGTIMAGAVPPGVRGGVPVGPPRHRRAELVGRATKAGLPGGARAGGPGP